MTMKTQMDKLVGYQTGGSIGGIDPSQRRIVKKAFRPPTDPEGERITLPIEGTIQPVPGTVGSPEYERYLEAIQNLPEGGLENLPRISAEPDTPTTELSPGGPDTSFVGGRDPMSVVLGLINKGDNVGTVLDGFNSRNDTSISIDRLANEAAARFAFSETPPGKFMGKVFDPRNKGVIAFLLNKSKLADNDPSLQEVAAMTAQAASARAQSLTADRAAQVAAFEAAAPQATPATTPAGTVASPHGGGQPALSIAGAASPAGQASGGLVQNMYDGGVVGKKKETKPMYDGGLV